MVAEMLETRRSSALTIRPPGPTDLTLNGMQRSPNTFMYRANITQGGREADNGTYVPSDEEETALTIARERLYMVIFADNRGYHPVCIRPSLVQLDKDSPASGAERVGWTSGVAMLSLALMWVLM